MVFEDNCVYKYVSPYLYVFLFALGFLGGDSNFLFILSYAGMLLCFILFYYSLDASYFSKERQKEYKFIWEGKLGIF